MACLFHQLAACASTRGLPSDREVFAKLVPQGNATTFRFADPASIKTRFVALPGSDNTVVNVAYFELGEPKRQPLLLIHGWGESKETWRYVVGELSRTFRVIALDLPGFGESDRPAVLRRARSNFTALQGEFICQFLQRIGLRTEDTVLIGHSMGGTIILEATHLCQMARGLVLIAPLEFGITDVPFSAAPFINYPVWLIRAANATGYTQVILRQNLQMLVYDPSHISAEYVSTLAGGLSRDGSIEVLAAGARTSIRRPDTSPSYQDWLSSKRALYRTVRAPTMIIWGKDDRLISSSTGAPIRKTIPSVEWVELERAGHIVQLDRPREVTQLIKRFVAALKR